MPKLTGLVPPLCFGRPEPELPTHTPSAVARQLQAASRCLPHPQTALLRQRTRSMTAQTASLSCWSHRQSQHPMFYMLPSHSESTRRPISCHLHPPAHRAAVHAQAARTCPSGGHTVPGTPVLSPSLAPNRKALHELRQRQPSFQLQPTSHHPHRLGKLRLLASPALQPLPACSLGTSSSNCACSSCLPAPCTPPHGLMCMAPKNAVSGVVTWLDKSTAMRLHLSCFPRSLFSPLGLIR